VGTSPTLFCCRKTRLLHSRIDSTVVKIGIEDSGNAFKVDMQALRIFAKVFVLSLVAGCAKVGSMRGEQHSSERSSDHTQGK
jgi:hypothetical protein